MATTVQIVERHLEKDLILKEALARGILNVRRAARQLIEKRGWDATEEAVVSALRRYEPDPHVDLDNVFDLLSKTHKTAQTGLVIISIERTYESLSKLTAITEAIATEDPLGFLPDDERLNIIAEEANTLSILKALHPEKPIEIHQDVAEIELEFPEKTPLCSAAIAVALHLLGHQGVEVVGTASVLPFCSVFVKEADFADAYALAKDLQLR